MTGLVGGTSGNPVHDGINSHGMRCWVTAPKPVSAFELRRFAAALMAAIATACLAAGAKDVSHVKAFLEHDLGFLHADAVGDPDQVKVEGRDGEPVQNFSLVVNAVIFGLSGDAVKEITEATVAATIARFGFAGTAAASGPGPGKKGNRTS